MWWFVWKSNEKRNCRVSVFPDASSAVEALLQTEVRDMPDEVLHMAGGRVYPTTWMEFLKEYG